MARTFGIAPSGDEIETIARAALAGLPAHFAEHLQHVLLLVQDFADKATLDALGIVDPFELSGIYEGIPVGEKSVSHSGAMPDRIRLFRRPILDEWAEREVETLEHLVTHVLIHEVGHHFGLSDDDIHGLEDDAE